MNHYRVIVNHGRVIVKSHYEEVIVVITRVRDGAKDEYNSFNNDNLRVHVMLCNKWSPEDNHVIAGLVSIFKG